MVPAYKDPVRTVHYPLSLHHSACVMQVLEDNVRIALRLHMHAFDVTELAHDAMNRFEAERRLLWPLRYDCGLWEGVALQQTSLLDRALQSKTVSSQVKC